MIYKKQVYEIAELCHRITKKAEAFDKNTQNPYFGDLLAVIEKLKEINTFLK